MPNNSPCFQCSYLLHNLNNILIIQDVILSHFLWLMFY